MDRAEKSQRDTAKSGAIECGVSQLYTRYILGFSPTRNEMKEFNAVS